MRKEKVFVIRLWSDSKNHDVWRASLENLVTKERQHFASLDDLGTHIKELQIHQN